MAQVLKPRIRAKSAAHRGGKAFSSSGDDYGQRLLKYIPLGVSGLFPILDSALADYLRTPVGEISPQQLDQLVLIALAIIVLIEVHRAYQKAGLHGRVRWWLQTVQSVFNLVAFVLWTYTVKGQVWGGTNNAALVVIFDGLFLAFAQYLPQITFAEAKQAGLVGPAQNPTDREKPPARDEQQHGKGE